MMKKIEIGSNKFVIDLPSGGGLIKFDFKDKEEEAIITTKVDVESLLQEFDMSEIVNSLHLVDRRELYDLLKVQFE